VHTKDVPCQTAQFVHGPGKMLTSSRTLHIPTASSAYTVRKMRGVCHAELTQTTNGLHVVKRTDNPQGKRVLVNEFLSHFLLSALEIRTPPIALVTFDGQAATADSTVHFGSRYVGSPDSPVIYDFLPDAFLEGVLNRDHFLGVLVFDKWVSNNDQRQAVFSRQDLDRDSKRSHWVADMIDNGGAFQGADWTFRESPVQGAYFRQAAYGQDLSWRDAEPWVERMMSLDWSLVDAARSQIPPNWIRGDESAVELLLTRLWKRRELIPTLVRDTIDWINHRDLRQYSSPLERFIDCQTVAALLGGRRVTCAEEARVTSHTYQRTKR
jgi:hypothetical protein